jgi:anti-sigma B factor antagonist
MPQTLVRPDFVPVRGDELAPAFVCSWSDGGPDAAWVHLTGELDIATAPQLERTLALPQLLSRVVVLDLRELAFLDSCGVHAIVDASNRARRADRRLVLLRGPPAVDRMFTLTGYSDQLEIGDLDPGEPPVQLLEQLADSDLGR